MKSHFLSIAVALFLVGCSPSSLEEYQLEAEGVAKALIKDLEKVESSKDLLEKGPRLKKRYMQLVDLMIEAKKHEKEHPDEEMEKSLGREVSDALKHQFIRIYAIDECKEIMEDLERESLHKLDQYINPPR